MTEPVLTQERLKELFHYDPEDGLFTRLISTSFNAMAGEIAGCNSHGYLQISIDGKGYLCHRLAYLYVEGFFPEHGIDHKKGIRHDNRWSQIEHATQQCNMQNQKIRTDNTSGFPGVTFYKRDNNWKAQAMLQGKCLHLGYHKTPLEAALSRLTWEAHCEDWKCNHQGELVKAIKQDWPEFNDRSIRK